MGVVVLVVSVVVVTAAAVVVVTVVVVAVVVVVVVVAVPVVVLVVFFHGRTMVHGTLGTHKPFNLSAANNPSSMNASTGAGLPSILIATM